MKEYTLLAVCAVFVTFITDKLTGVNILRRKEFYLFIAVILMFKLLVNGYLTGEGIVRYNPEFLLGIRLGSIPFEDFLFGFSMVTLGIIFWELFKRRGA